MNVNQLITENIQYAKNIAKKQSRKYFYVNYDELEAAAYMGLVEAARRYDPEQNEFPAYAYSRIVGAIEDYLRELRWGSRSRPVKTTEIVEKFSYQEENNCLFDKLTVDLTKVRKMVLHKYYVEGMKIQEIAILMEVNESRISQLLSESRFKLKQSWCGREYELWAEVA